MDGTAAFRSKFGIVVSAGRQLARGSVPPVVAVMR